MDEIILCNQKLTSEFVRNHCGLEKEKLIGFGCENPALLDAYTPYLVENKHSVTGKVTLMKYRPLPVSRELTDLSLSFGVQNVVALAEMNAKLQEFNIGALGASTTLYASRVSGFANAVKHYQNALLGYRDSLKSNPGAKGAAKQKAFQAFQTMQRGFQQELALVTNQTRSRRGTALSDPTRATNIARSSRNIAKLQLSGHLQATHLVNFVKYAKFLGNGLVVIDFASRVGNVHNSYQGGGNWERELFVESSSFLMSIGAGSVAINVGARALTYLVLATPIGWVGLVVGGLAVAGVAAASSVAMNHFSKSNSGKWYDAILESIPIL